MADDTFTLVALQGSSQHFRMRQPFRALSMPDHALAQHLAPAHSTRVCRTLFLPDHQPNISHLPTSPESAGPTFCQTTSPTSRTCPLHQVRRALFLLDHQANISHLSTSPTSAGPAYTNPTSRTCPLHQLLEGPLPARRPVQHLKPAYFRHMQLHDFAKNPNSLETYAVIRQLSEYGTRAKTMQYFPNCDAMRRTISTSIMCELMLSLVYLS